MDAVSIPVSLALLYLLRLAFCFYRNYRKALSTGFTMYMTPIDFQNPLFYVFCVPLLPLAKRLLPRSIYHTLNLSMYGFEWRDHLEGNQRDLPGYTIVGPTSSLELYVEDPQLINAILTRRQDFEMDADVMKVMNILGPTLAGTDGDDWQRHRRLIAPMLNERIMETVWAESGRQANEMLKYFMDREGGTTDETLLGLTKLAFNVLQRAGYGMTVEWEQEAENLSKDGQMGYSESILQLLRGRMLLVIFNSSRLLTLSFLPESVRKTGEAFYAFCKQSQELLESERRATSASGQPKNNLLSLLATMNHEDAEKGSKSSKPVLSGSETTGNLFMLTLAGFDNTSNSLGYAFTLLAMRPKLQAWIIEELDQVRGEVSDPGSYREVFPKLKRCLALMNETLRIFTPAGHIYRECSREQSITIGDKTYRIPAKTRVALSLSGAGNHTEFWGDDAHEFKPSRWLSSSLADAGVTPPTSTVTPRLEPPVKGSFIPFSAGPRVCPGMKMSQVEFLSVMWNVFLEYRVDPALRDGESLEDARKRLQDMINDSQPLLTLRIRNPKSVVLKWTKR